MSETETKVKVPISVTRQILVLLKEKENSEFGVPTSVITSKVKSPKEGKAIPEGSIYSYLTTLTEMKLITRVSHAHYKITEDGVTTLQSIEQLQGEF